MTAKAFQSFPAMAIWPVIFLRTVADGGCRDGYPWTRELKGAFSFRGPGLRAALFLRRPLIANQHNRMARRRRARRPLVVQPVFLNMKTIQINLQYLVLVTYLCSMKVVIVHKRFAGKERTVAHLKMAFHFVVGEPINLHHLPDLLWSSNCKHDGKNLWGPTRMLFECSW